MNTIAFILLIASTPAGSVYKCKDAAGVSVYSAGPCASDPAKVVEIKVKEHKGPNPATAAASNNEAMRRNVERADIGHAEQRCLEDATASIWGPAQQRIAAMQTEIAELNRSIGYSANNLAGQTRSNGLRQQIAGLGVSITTERTAAEAMFAQERQRCGTQRRAAQQAFEERNSSVDAEK
jgi:hypothetical protein